jgi:hypothetical protein
VDARGEMGGRRQSATPVSRANSDSTFCKTHAMSAPQSRDGSGRWPRGVSGNPGGRPQSLAKATRELVGEEGRALAELWWSIAQDETRRDRDRLEASKLLAERGWGKAPAFAAVEDRDPLGLEDAEQAAGELRAEIVRLAGQRKAAYKPS